jgi:hypothetical protein
MLEGISFALKGHRRPLYPIASSVSSRLEVEDAT